MDRPVIKRSRATRLISESSNARWIILKRCLFSQRLCCAVVPQLQKWRSLHAWKTLAVGERHHHPTDKVVGLRAASKYSMEDSILDTNQLEMLSNWFWLQEKQQQGVRSKNLFSITLSLWSNFGFYFQVRFFPQSSNFILWEALCVQACYTH